MKSPQKFPSPAAKEEKRSRVLDVVVNDVVEDLSVTRPDGTPYVKRYHRGRYLGKGGFAKCYELKSADSGKSYAAKVISKTSLAKVSARKRLLGEIKVHRSLHHENVVKFERFFEDKDNAYILLELCENQSLIELLKQRRQVTETECQYIMWKLIHIVKYLHTNKVIHRDLKLGNIFLSATMEIKVGDFGLATKLENAADRRRTMCGTPNYIAPEILEGTHGHSFEVDVWALGIIMYTVLIGRPPFETNSIKSTYKRIRANNYVFPAHIPLSRAAKELIIAILHPDPALRPTLDQMAATPFFTQSSFPLSLPTSCLTQPLEWEHANPHLPCIKPRPPLADKVINVDSQSHDSPKFEGFEEVEVCNAADKENIVHKAGSPGEGKAMRSPMKLRRSPGNHLGITRPKSALFPSSGNGRPNVLSPSRLQRPVLPPPQRSSSSTTTASSSTTTSKTSAPFASTTTSVTAAKPGDRKSLDTEPSAQRPVPLKLPRLSTAEERQLVAQLEHLRVGDVKAEQKVGTSPLGEDEDGALRTVHDDLEECYQMLAPREGDGKARLRQGSKPWAAVTEPEVFVNKWVDYSNKYGMGYLLSNGNTGVHFNDCAVMIMHHKGQTIEHIPALLNRGLAAEPRDVLGFDNYPSALKKKVTLLKHFYQYLQQGKGSVGEAPDIIVDGHSDVQTANDGPTNMVYVKKWLRTKHALVFRLSNGIIQVVFYDQTEIILCPDERMVTYSNKAKERTTYPLGAVFQIALPDLSKRVKYLKDILHHLLSRSLPTS